MRSGICCGAVEAHRQHARDVKRFALGAVVDLMPAGGAVGDDQRILVGAPHGGQQRQLGHLDRGTIGVSAVTERAGHAAAARFDGLDLQVRNEAQHLLDRLEGAEGFLVTMAVYHGLVGDAAERQLQPAGFGLAHQKFLEGQRMGADRLGILVFAQ